jgi:hypothetical protein
LQADPMTGDSAVTSMSERSTYSLIFFGFDLVPRSGTSENSLSRRSSAADFRWMIDVGASVTGSLQFAKLCSIYVTPCDVDL